MKKSLLLIAAVAVALTASATEPQKVSSMKKNQVVNKEFTQVDLTPEVAVMATPAQRQAAKAKKAAAKADVQAWYNRPAGTFYRSMTSTLGAYYSPAVILPAYRDVTWVNASEGENLSSQWGYQKYNTTTSAWDSLVVNTTDLTDNFIRSSMGVPSLTVTDGTNSSTWAMNSYYYNSSSSERTEYAAYNYYYTDPRASFEDNSLDCYVTPKYFSAGTRSQTTTRGVVYYTGAKDADGGTTGCWFGKNYSGWNGMAMYVEKPQNPYALRHIVLAYANYAGTGDADLTAKVYSVTEHSDTALVLGDVLYQGKATLKSDADEYGFLSIPLTEEEDGLEYEVVGDINDEIAIVVSGYDNANITSWSMLISCDTYDEGYGQHGYMMHIENGEPTKTYGLDNFFTTSLGVTAPTVFLDIEWPIMMWNYTFEDGVYNFPAEGGKLTRTYGTTYSWDYLSIYSSKSADEMTVTTEDGEDIPEWLTVELTDVIEEEEFTGEVQAAMTATALPEGTTYRECNVKFAVPGASLIAKISQGEKPASLTGDVNGDGVVNTSDVTALINIILGSAETVPAADVNGDGTVDTSDITALLNIILGA